MTKLSDDAVREKVQSKATSEIADWDKPLDDFGIDSLDLLDINLDLEEEMGVIIPESEFQGDNYPSLNQFVAHVQQYG